eukprot:5616110-Amphidinium_carterae.4
MSSSKMVFATEPDENSMGRSSTSTMLGAIGKPEDSDVANCNTGAGVGELSARLVLRNDAPVYKMATSQCSSMATMVDASCICCSCTT